MATANPATAGQEQPPAPAAPASQHTDTLQSMLNLIFLHSGRFLKETQAGGGSGRMKQQLQRVVPHATERFHDALDELENEVRLAQTVLRRDMALLKQDRKKKEAAAKQHEVEKARLAAESRNAPAARVDDAPVKEEKAATPPPPEPPAVQDVPESPKAKEPGPEPEPAKKEREDAKAPPPPPIETNVEPPKDPLFDATPTTANPHESDFDFDAMFGDAMDTSGDHHPHHDMMDTSGDMDFNLDDGNDGQSLLRGLEDFAKDGEDNNANQTSNMDIDFTVPDLPGLDMNTNDNSNTNADNNAAVAEKPAPEPEPAPVPAPVAAPKAEEPKPAAQPPPEEKKEETTNNDDMMATMATDDLEDLFNMDEYENPEQSSFDDAFFNFDQKHLMLKSTSLLFKMMTTTPSEPTPSEAPSNPPHTFDRNHPDQREITAILAKFNKGPLSVISLGKDGVLRTLSADRAILDAVGLSPRLVKAFLDRVPPDYRALTPELEDADGSKASEEELWLPNASLLPRPMSEEHRKKSLAQLEESQQQQAKVDHGGGKETDSVHPA
ncbi:hypothetical protein DDE82_004177 [Stemphylium lycopersici]|nr:hypothetical protein DDE82_004177 [Stemphylium lycopersici]